MVLKSVTGKMGMGFGDIGTILHPSQFNEAEADDYVFNELNERIYFVIKSKKDEYCFTNLGLIHVDGESSVSAKRTVRRCDLRLNTFRNVTIETAGNMDRDVELKFTLNGVNYSIDVRKEQLELLKDLYKALMEIERQHDFSWNRIKKQRSNLDAAVAAAGRVTVRCTEYDITEQAKQLDQFMNEKYETIQSSIINDYGPIYELFLNN